MKKFSISVFLPAFNEEENISFAIDSIYPYLKKNFSKWELIVVNDGSTDKTAEIVKKMMKTRPNLRLAGYVKNRGYGGALRTGFAAAKYDWVFYTDADSQFDIADLEKLLPLTKEADIVAGYRLNRQDPLMRIFIARVYGIIIRLALGLKIRDVDCSFKLYKRNIFKNMILISETGLIDAEVLIKAVRAGYIIKQVGVRHFPRTRGQTIYEMGGRNKIVAFVKPQVVTNLLREIGNLREQLKQNGA